MEWILIIWLHSQYGAPTVGPTFQCGGLAAVECQKECEAASVVLHNAGLNAICIKKTR